MYIDGSGDWTTIGTTVLAASININFAFCLTWRFVPCFTAIIFGYSRVLISPLVHHMSFLTE